MKEGSWDKNYARGKEIKKNEIEKGKKVKKGEIERTEERKL